MGLTPAVSASGQSPWSHWRLVAAAVVAMWLVAGAARAITLRDIIELSRAGVSDDVLVELVEMEATVFRLTAANLLELKEAGVSDRVVVVMIQSARNARIERERLDHLERLERDEAEARAIRAAGTTSRSPSIVTGEERDDPSTSRQPSRAEPVVVAVPFPVVIQQVVQVGDQRSRRAGAVGRQAAPTSQRTAAAPAEAPHGAGRHRGQGNEDRPAWIVKTSGWVVK